MNTPRDPLLIPVLSFGNFVIGMGAFVVIGLLEPLGADMNRSAAEAGQLMTIYALGYAVLSPLLVALTGQIGRRRVLTLAMGLFTLAALMATLAGSYWTLSLSRILAAAGAGMFTPVAAAVAAALFPEAQRARALAAVFFGLTLAQVLGVPVGSFIAYTFGWRCAFAVVVALSVPTMWLLWVRVPAGLRFQPVALKDLGTALTDLRSLLAICFTGSFIGALYVLYTYITPLMSSQMGFGRDGITAILLVYGGGAVIGNIMGGILTDRFGWRRTLTALCISQMILMPMHALLPLPAPTVFALSFVWAVFGWAFMSAQQLRLITFSGPRAPVVLALNAAALYLGAAAGSALGGLVLAQFGISALGIAGGLCAALALLHLRLSINRPPAVFKA